MSWINRDILQLYNNYFQEPYKIPDEWVNTQSANAEVIEDYTNMGIRISSTDMEDYKGREIFLPIRLYVSDDLMIEIPCCTIRITSKKTIIRTAVSERIGTVKEQFNVGDYQFTIKGVLTGVDYKFPEDKIRKLKDIYESTQSVRLLNALVELFMPGFPNVSIESLEFPEQEGKHIRHRPFVMVCETDFIDTLTYTE